MCGTFLAFLAPLPAQAGFFSSILGDNAYADTPFSNTQAPITSSTKPSETSGIMDLLQANVSPALVIQDKNDKKDSKDDSISTGMDVNIVSNTAILPATGPMGVSDGKDVVDPSSLETSVYVVRKGDSISQIADMFGVSVNTILWANDMKKGDKLNEGDVLFVLPISGLEHTVTKGQTLASIAKLYKVDVVDIVQNNDIAENTALAIGDTLMIPDAVKSEESGKPIQNLGASIAKDKLYYQQHYIQNLAGYFINPVPGYRLSQGLHDGNSVDLAISPGTPIHASASGVIILAKTGCVVGAKRCGGGFGNVVVIAHPNGTQTLYAHQSKVVVITGEQVYQGQVIGYVGSTGRSTGPHIHFQVKGAQNPGANGSWKY